MGKTAKCDKKQTGKCKFNPHFSTKIGFFNYELPKKLQNTNLYATVLDATRRFSTLLDAT
jgi:hypothetical protein